MSKETHRDGDNILGVGVPAFPGDRLHLGYINGDKNPKLKDLYNKLVEPAALVLDKLDPDSMDVSVVELNTPEYETALDIINYAYNTSYNGDGNSIRELANDPESLASTTRTVITSKTIDGVTVIGGTFRVGWGSNLETFRLFDNSNGWSQNGVAELSRFALNPIFDVGRKRLYSPKERDTIALYKRLLLRKLWPVGMELLDKEKIEQCLFVLTPEVRVFVESSGLNPIPVEGVSPSSSDYANKLRREFSRYWRPDDVIEMQPRVYIAPREVLPFQFKIDNGVVTIGESG